MMISEQLTEIYELLFSRFGPQHWWPGQGRFEIIVGAILTQNTNWNNVEKAIANLKSADCLSPQKLFDLEQEQLAPLIRPAGYYNIKTKRLKNFIEWLFTEYGGDLDNLEQIGTARLREEFLGIKGIGRETADSILLYALGRPIFVIDTYTARITARHQLIEPEADYEQIQDLFASNLAEDVQLFNEYHALLVRTGKEYCRPKPRCDGCPLEKLPHVIDTDLYWPPDFCFALVFLQPTWQKNRQRTAD